MGRFKIDTTGSVKSDVKFEQDATHSKQKKEFVRTTGDNSLFPEIQVTDITKITDENTVMVLDSDGIVWKACSSAESLYIIAKHKTEDVSVELDGVQKFKGLGKKISVDSWLGVQNVKREVQGLPLWAADDFEVEQFNRLNFDTEAKAWEHVQITIRTKLKNLRIQFGIEKILMIMGEGKCFREDLGQIKKYKGQRSPLRPIMLKRARKWVLDELGGEDAPAGFEGDDVCTWYAFKSHLNYKKTGIHTYMACCEDKDALGTPCLLANFGTHSGKDNPLKGQFKFPNPWLIGDTSEGVGCIDLVVKGKKELKCTGLMQLVAQSFLIGDTSDNYSALKHYPQKTDYADVAAYKDFAELKVPKDVLQKVVDLYAKLFPYGNQFEDYKGQQVDIDTMQYMNRYFLTAYMTRSANDSMDWYKLCKAFDVDVSAITDNNLLSAPVKVFNKDNAEKVLDDLKVVCDNLIPPAKGWKSLKKADKDIFVEKMMQNIEDMKPCFEDFYEMKQLPKQ